MLIDWFTVTAQVVNFLILVWLLKRFLYRPILDAIDAREKRIATALAEAAARKAEAQRERDAFVNKNASFEQQRATLLAQAIDEVEAERLRLLDAARQEAEALSAKQWEVLRSEQQSLRTALTDRAREEVFAIARKTLVDLAGESLEDRMVSVFIGRVRALDAAVVSALRPTVGAASAPLLVRTSSPLSPTHRAALEAALKESIDSELRVEFETAPNLISGIEVSANGRKVAWSISDYLASLAESVDELLKTQPKRDASVRAEAERIDEPGT